MGAQMKMNTRVLHSLLACGAIALSISGCNDSNSSPASLTIGGTVSGLSGTVVLQRVGGETLSISADGGFTFPTPAAEGSSYAVSVNTQPAGGTCTVTKGSGVVGSAGVTGITVTCVANAFTAGGTISGLIGTVVLQNNGADSLSISTDGVFTFPIPVTQGKPYAVTVLTQPADQTCSVGKGSGPMGAAKVTNVAVVCSTHTFTIGGTVSGLIGSLVLEDNGGDALTMSSNGTFTFATPVAQGSTYHVTVQTQPSTQTCTVANGTDPLGAANVSNVTVICAVNAYTVGGTVSGLTGTVTLLDNGGDTLPVSGNGSFTFPTPVAEGSSYNVTVQTQPVIQTCMVTNGVDPMGVSDVTNVTVICATNNTTLTVAATGQIPVNNGYGNLTVTNTGSYAATNVYAILPPGWTAVGQDASNCTMIPPNQFCNLGFISTVPYVAQGGIVITGDNISSPPTTALAFTIQGFLVFSVDSSSSASVIDTADLGTQVWGNTGMRTGAQSLTDGVSNTITIIGTPGIGASAAVDCYGSTSGGAAAGTWYLPAICQMGPAGQGAACPTGLANIDTNLVQLGFGGLSPYSWSSTEYSTNPQDVAWFEFFQTGGGSVQSGVFKQDIVAFRCVRSITY
jgi:hypothetical protein